jgi:hypothetical protein
MPQNVQRQAYRMVSELKHTRALIDYIRTFQKLMLDVPNMSDENRLNWFIVGLQPWAQSEVERSNPETLEEAYMTTERLVDTPRKTFTPSTKARKKSDHRGKKEDRRCENLLWNLWRKEKENRGRKGLRLSRFLLKKL